jgi:hypothetical protein
MECIPWTRLALMNNSGSERGKKRCGSFSLREVVDKALPIAFPHRLVVPAQPTTQSTPELGIEEEVIYMNGAEGMQSEDTSPQTGVAVLECVLISAFSGFGQCLLDGHKLCSLHLH